jgi:hypothetical protein
MAPLNIGRRPRWLPPIVAGFVVTGLVGLGSAAKAQDRNAHDEAVAALADIDSAIGKLSKSSDLTANTEGPYKQAAQGAAAAIAGALGHLDWLADKAVNVWSPAVEGSVVNLQVAKGSLDAAARTNGLEEFWPEVSRALRALLVAAGRESAVGALGGLRGALATTTLGVPRNGRTVSGCSLRPEYRRSSIAAPDRDQKSLRWQRLHRPAHRGERSHRPLVPALTIPSVGSCCFDNGRTICGCHLFRAVSYELACRLRMGLRPARL